MKLRLAVMMPHVDHVYIVEAWQPHAVSGPRKTALFSETAEWRAVWQLYPGKVTILAVEEFPPEPPASWLFFMKTRVWNLKMNSIGSWWRVRGQA